MSFQKHMYMSLLFVAFALDRVGAMRVQPTKSVTHKEPQEKPFLHDVTKHVDEAFESRTGYKCCCDKRKPGEAGNADDERGINSDTRANYCAISYRWPFMKCSHPWVVKVREDTQTAHDFRDTGGTCEIARDNVKVLAAALKKSDYCPENKYTFEVGGKNMQIDIPATALGETSKAPCPDGSEGTVTCLAGTPTVGYWGPVQCDGEGAWCPAIPESEDGAPHLPAAHLEDEVFVNCFPKRPSSPNTKCDKTGWLPEGGPFGFLEGGLPPMCFPQ
jgi:hypothetical protein